MFGDTTLDFMTNGDSLMVEIRGTSGDGEDDQPVCYVDTVAGIFGGAAYLHAHGGGWEWGYMFIGAGYARDGQAQFEGPVGTVQEKHQDGGVELVYAWLKLARSFNPQQVKYGDDFKQLVDKRLRCAGKAVYFGSSINGWQDLQRIHVGGTLSV